MLKLCILTIKNTCIDFLFPRQFDLVCERELYGTIGSSMIFVGFFFGGVAVGPFSDKFGRKITMYISGIIVSVVSLLAAFPQAFWLFALCRCVIGFGIGRYEQARLVLYALSVGCARNFWE